jgi:hypothetical protein
MKIASFLIPTLIFSLGACTPKGESESETKLRKLSDENDSLQTIISASDSIYDKSRELTECVTDMTYLTSLWVWRQSSNDTQEKQTLLNEEAHCQLLLDQMKLHLKGDDIDSNYETVSDKSEEFLSLVNQVKTFLPSFESYEDPINFMRASTMVESGGPLDSMAVALIMAAENLAHTAERNGKMNELKVERNKVEMEMIREKERK